MIDVGNFDSVPIRIRSQYRVFLKPIPCTQTNSKAMCAYLFKADNLDCQRS